MKTDSIVLIDSGWPQTLYLIDSLLEHALDIFLITLDEVPRHLDHIISGVKVSSFQSPEFTSIFEECINNTKVKWIFALNEDAIQFCYSKYPTSSKLYPRISPAIINLIGNKHLMAEFASGVGLSVPEFSFPKTNDNLVESAQQWGYPIVVKGFGGCGGSQVAICKDEIEAFDSYRRLSKFQPIVQRFIKGNTWVAGGFFIDGKPIRLQICEAIDLDPPDRGISITIRNSAPLSLERQFIQLCSALNWSGFACADFVESHDGLFYFMEINPRPWSAMTAGLASGIDIFSPLAAVLLNKAPIACLDTKVGWMGKVFPAHIRALAQNKNYLGLAICLASPSFWRGVPKKHLKTFLYLMKQVYWIIRKH